MQTVFALKHKMKKRYVKRLVRKIVLFVLIIAFICVVTTMIVEKRMDSSSNKKDEENLDGNGDPITSPYSRLNSELVTQRRPRPPFQPRNLPLSEERKVAFDLEALLKVEDDSQFQLPMPRGEKKDWHDYEALERDKKRVGLGEHGLPAYNEEAERDIEEKLFKKNGFNGLLSDKISVNRSLPDVRREECRKRQYLAKLPRISVIIIFFDEHFSALIRSVHSIVNRTPSELLQEIILVDDGSERKSLKSQLDEYVAMHWPQKAHIVRNNIRVGLIGARLAGAKVASADVMVFFDSHIEVNYNWLPPLLEPIAINQKISTCPIVDIIDYNNFAYNGGYQEGSRGGFDWRLFYKQLPVLPEDSVEKSQPYRNPVMMGGLFAIDRKFFWELGGYDDQLEIWGGEQYELSFKIWMCGGMLLDVPCSRVAHIFRGPMEPRPSKNYNFVGRNYKRVVEVWMDDYKQYVYDRDPQTYHSIDAGNLTAQRAVRDRLKCKSFHWYMSVVAPDFLKKFPPIEPPAYAQGAVQNIAYPDFCLDTLNMGSNHAVGMYRCAENMTHPHSNQFWALTADRDMRLYQRSDCLDVQDSMAYATVWIWSCHNQGGNQFWHYDRNHKWLVHGFHGNRCMEALMTEDGNIVVSTNICNESNNRMQWHFGYVNDALLDTFFEGLTLN